MKDKKHLGKLALASLLVAASLPIDAQAINGGNATEVLLAVASCKTCGGGGGKLSTDDGRGELADAAGDLSMPRGSSQGGAYGSQNNVSGRNLGGTYGSQTDSSGYTTPYYRAPVTGGSYGSPGSRVVGSSGEAGSWPGSNTRNEAYLNSAGNPEYNYQGYNTNRGFNTSPTYEGRYWDSSSSAGTVAPYGYDTHASNRYEYEGVATPGIITEAQLLNQLSDQGKQIYRFLGPEGKALALQLASQSNNSNKDFAVTEAQKQIAMRQNAMRNR